MEYESSTKNKVDLIQSSIQQLNNNDENHQLLSNLLSQLEELKPDNPPEPVAEPNEELPSYKSSSETEAKDDEDETKTSKNEKREDVVKNLKKLEKQNRITHGLLSALILLTLAWQLSEFSLLMRLKEGVTNPFKSVGNMFKNILKRPRLDEQDRPKLPCVELPELVISDEKKL